MTSTSSRLTLLAAATLGLAACSKPADDAASTPKADTPAASIAGLESPEQRASYGIGFNVGRDLASQPGLTIDQSAFASGFADALAQKNPQLTVDQIQAAFTTMQDRANQATNAAAETNLKAAAAFLETNKSKPGIQTTASGLQYEVISSGTGAKPKPENTVEVHYHGTLIDGTVFDSSVQRGETIEFPVTRVIPGWTEALQLMSVGDKWRLFIPPGLGYGPRAAGKIPPNSALIFEVELIGIK
jgi:FKBP-type peptidyl-prolyl cis-trans isomerase